MPAESAADAGMACCVRNSVSRVLLSCQHAGVRALSAPQHKGSSGLARVSQ